MKKSLVNLTVLFLFILCSGCSLTRLANDIPQSESAISEKRVHDYLFFLASDSLKGRDTPSPGLDSAAAFISGEFKNLGISPVNGSYFQEIALGKVNLAKDNFLKIKKDGNEISYNIKKEFTPFELTAGKAVSSQIVFVGYGIDAPEYNYNDYENFDVKGKIVFILNHEPGEYDSSSVFEGIKQSKYSGLKYKINTAVKHGALAILIAQDPLNHKLLTPQGFPWPSLSKLIPPDALPLTLLIDEKDKIPAVQVGKEVIEQLFGSVNNLSLIQAGIDKNIKPNSFLIEGADVNIKTSTEIEHFSARNVVGLIEGSDPELKNEIIIIGAHYDHVGFIKQHNDNEDYIYNGADDNASGTTGMMAVASAFAMANEKPKRSVLFIAFAGEEKGLYGSKFYTENPLFPLKKTVAMLNLDMVGRNNIDSLSILAGEFNPSLRDINEKQNIKIGFNLKYNEDPLGGSDHENFLKNGVPALFYFSGMHPDYHQTSDNPEKINIAKVQRVARLVFRTAWYLSNNKIYFDIIKKYNSLF